MAPLGGIEFPYHQLNKPLTVSMNLQDLENKSLNLQDQQNTGVMVSPGVVEKHCPESGKFCTPIFKYTGLCQAILVEIVAKSLN